MNFFTNKIKPENTFTPIVLTNDDTNTQPVETSSKPRIISNLTKRVRNFNSNITKRITKRVDNFNEWRQNSRYISWFYRERNVIDFLKNEFNNNTTDDTLIDLFKNGNKISLGELKNKYKTYIFSDSKNLINLLKKFMNVYITTNYEIILPEEQINNETIPTFTVKKIYLDYKMFLYLKDNLQGIDIYICYNPGGIETISSNTDIRKQKLSTRIPNIKASYIVCSLYQEPKIVFSIKDKLFDYIQETYPYMSFIINHFNTMTDFSTMTDFNTKNMVNVDKCIQANPTDPTNTANQCNFYIAQKYFYFIMGFFPKKSISHEDGNKVIYDYYTNGGIYHTKEALQYIVYKMYNHGNDKLFYNAKKGTYMTSKGDEINSYKEYMNYDGPIIANVTTDEPIIASYVTNPDTSSNNAILPVAERIGGKKQANKRHTRRCRNKKHSRKTTRRRAQ